METGVREVQVEFSPHQIKNIDLEFLHRHTCKRHSAEFLHSQCTEALLIVMLCKGTYSSPMRFPVLNNL